MEYGSVLELDEIYKYEIPKERKQFLLPFMEANHEEYRLAFYQSGRNAIEALLTFLKHTKKVNRLLLPDYVCQTVKDAAQRAGMEIAEYRVDRNYKYSAAEISGLLQEGCAVYLCHYFGQPIESDILTAVKRWQNEGRIVIEDLTMSLLSKETCKVGFGTYILGSLRKWFPIPDGGFLAAGKEPIPEETVSHSVSKYTDYYMMVQMMKRKYICEGCIDAKLKEIYMEYYKLSIEELFSDYKIYPMSEWSRNYLQNISTDDIVKERMRNYDFLYDELKGTKGIRLKIKRQDGYLPLGMVLECSDRDELLQYLIENNVYCNVHWRLQGAGNEDMEYLANHSITVPCDQRYSIEDIRMIAAVIKRWCEKKYDCIST